MKNKSHSTGSSVPLLDRAIVFLVGIGIMVIWGALLCGICWLLAKAFPVIRGERWIYAMVLIIFGILLFPSVLIGSVFMGMAFEKKKDSNNKTEQAT